MTSPISASHDIQCRPCSRRSLRRHRLLLIIYLVDALPFIHQLTVHKPRPAQPHFSISLLCIANRFCLSASSAAFSAFLASAFLAFFRCILVETGNGTEPDPVWGVDVCKDIDNASKRGQVSFPSDENAGRLAVLLAWYNIPSVILLNLCSGPGTGGLVFGTHDVVRFVFRYFGFHGRSDCGRSWNGSWGKGRRT